VVGSQRAITKDIGKFLEVLKCYFDWVMVSQMYTFVDDFQTVNFKYVYCISIVLWQEGREGKGR
jgi:hypothetical protein